MKTISTADIVFSTQILCIFCVLGLLIMWGGSNLLEGMASTHLQS